MTGYNVGATTHKTALVLIPPRNVWESIERIRRRHDRQAHRWMPHVTLSYPFRPHGEFEALADPLRAACRPFAPVEVTLGELRWFAHGGRNFTIWLAPEPADALVRLQAALQPAAPDCDDVQRFGRGFVPHLSVGQAKGVRRLAQLVVSLQAAWRPISFTATEVALIWRGEPPDDVFRVDHAMPLGEA